MCQELEDILRECEIPSLRRDITKPENVRWLLRNLGVMNSEDKQRKAAPLLKALISAKGL